MEKEFTLQMIKLRQKYFISFKSSFLGVEGYYQPFIQNFPAKDWTLARLLKKESAFHGDATQEKKLPRTKIAYIYACLSL